MHTGNDEALGSDDENYSDIDTPSITMALVSLLSLCFSVILIILCYLACRRRIATSRPSPNTNGNNNDDIPMNDVETEDQLRRSEETISDVICSICLRKIKHDDQVVKLDCDHSFHKIVIFLKAHDTNYLYF